MPSHLIFTLPVSSIFLLMGNIGGQVLGKGGTGWRGRRQDAALWGKQGGGSGGDTGDRGGRQEMDMRERGIGERW